MRIVFFGTGEFGQASLRALAAEHEVVLVVSQPDRPRGRGLKLAPTAIKQTALELGLPVYQPEKINRPEVLERLAQAPADLGVVIAYGQKIGAAVRGLYRLRCVNLHASLLPRWRGAAPVQWAILGGDDQTGVTIFELVDAMDAGPMIVRAATPLGPGETAETLHDRLAAFGVAPLLDAVAQLGAGTAALTPQDEAQVTLARKLTRADSVLDFARPARELARQVHGLWSWPGAQADFVRPDGRRETVTLARVEALDAAPPAGAEPGTLCGNDEIACGQGRLKVRALKPAGKGVMDWSAFANGRRIQGGPGGDRFAAPSLPG